MGLLRISWTSGGAFSKARKSFEKRVARARRGYNHARRTHGRGEDQVHSERAVPRLRPGDDHGLAGTGRAHDRGGQGRVAVPLRRLGQQAVLRQHPRAHRLRGRRAEAVQGGGPAVTTLALAAALLLLRLTGALAPTLSADLDGDGREETVTATPGRG